MDKLISFLTQNFYFVIVAVGIIYSLFFRKSPLEKPPNRMPDFGGGGQRRPERTVETRAPRDETLQSEPVEVRFPSPEEVVQQTERRNAGHRPQPQSAEARQQHEKPATSSIAAHLTKEDLKQAIVWAEILGPPRARRPYGRQVNK